MTRRISLTEVSRRAPRVLARGDSKLLEEGAPPTLNDLAGALQFALGDGRIWLNDDRMVLMQTTSLGLLRREMIEAVGQDRTATIFRKIGWEQGVRLADVVSKRFHQDDMTAALAAGPRIHTMEGHVKVTTKRFEFDARRNYYHGEFHWHDSTEAGEHVAHFGIADCPVCWMLIGVPSGYTTRLLGHPVIFREVECAGQGAERCVVIGRNAEAWDDDVPELEEFGLVSPARPKSKPWNPPVDLPPQEETTAPNAILGKSAAIVRARRLIERVGGYSEPVMLLGESGTGKEHFARRLHEIGRKPGGPFISVNCGMYEYGSPEIPLLGEGGALTRAKGGTLFLNDILALPMALQGQLASALGIDERARPDLRVVSASSGSPREAVDTGRFRADLFFKLSLLPIVLPPLRERRDDLPLLIEHFLRVHSRHHRKPLGKIGGAAMDLLLRYDYPGNVRELSNMIERGVIYVEPGDDLDITHLFTGIEEMPEFVEGLHAGGTIVRRRSGEAEDAERTLAEIEEDAYLAALTACDWNISAAARRLGLTRAKLEYRVKKFGLRPGRSD